MTQVAPSTGARMAHALRVGLGLVFVIGGWNKLGQLLNPAQDQAILASYWSAHGCVNAFFDAYLFDGRFGDWLTPWVFFSTLSAFELLSGIALVCGLLVRPLALVWGLLLWTFVAALPVVTAPGVSFDVETFTAPAILVQIRDIALSGMFFVLFNLGAGTLAIDRKPFAAAAVNRDIDWDALGLLLRLSLALPLLVGGVFAGLPGIPTFAASGWVLLPLGLLLVAAVAPRYVAAAVAALMIWLMGSKLNMDESVIANLNGFKRELAFLAAAGVIAAMGGGQKFALRLPAAFQNRREARTA